MSYLTLLAAETSQRRRTTTEVRPLKAPCPVHVENIGNLSGWSLRKRANCPTFGDPMSFTILRRTLFQRHKHRHWIAVSILLHLICYQVP